MDPKMHPKLSKGGKWGAKGAPKLKKWWKKGMPKFNAENESRIGAILIPQVDAGR